MGAKQAGVPDELLPPEELLDDEPDELLELEEELLLAALVALEDPLLVATVPEEVVEVEPAELLEAAVVVDEEAEVDVALVLESVVEELPPEVPTDPLLPDELLLDTLDVLAVEVELAVEVALDPELEDASAGTAQTPSMQL